MPQNTRHSKKGAGRNANRRGHTVMIKEENALIITFDTGTEAFEADKFAMKNKIPAQLISMPGELKAGCGLALKAPADCKDKLPDELKQAGIKFDQATVMMV